VPAEESYIFGIESKQTNLDQLTFAEFSSMIKSFGYTNIGGLTQPQLQAINDELNGTIDLVTE